MTTCSTANARVSAPGACRWLVLAASPTFALMAWIAAGHALPTGLCGSGSGVLSLGGMTEMYLLMSLFHLSPWLELASGPRARNPHPIEGDQS